MSINKLEPESNAIRNLDSQQFSFEAKKEMIQLLKENNNYQKDDSLKTEKIDNHKKKQDVINKLVIDGRTEREIVTLKNILYPDSVSLSLYKKNEWITEEMRSDMDYRYNKMYENNKPLKEDIKKLYQLPLSVREESGERVISLAGYGEFGSTINAGMVYRDMDKDGKREIDYLSQSKKFLTFKNKVKGMEIMLSKDTYSLMNIIGKQIGITDKIDLNYINTVYAKYPNKNLPKNHDVGRVLRCMSIILGKWFVIPILVDGNSVRSIDCYDYNAGVCDSYDKDDKIYALFKIDSFHSK